MSQTIKPVNWLETTLWLLEVSDIFKNTTSEVVNDKGGELWNCNLNFEIPIRNNNELRQDITQVGRPMPTKVGAQIDDVLSSLHAVERIGYHIPDWSSLKIQALQQHSLEVPRVSERHATSTIWMWYVVYYMRTMFIYSYYYMSTS
jgi:hypothetical protein